MHTLSRKATGVVLVVIVLVSAYVTIVQTVNALMPKGFLKSFIMESLRKSCSASKFVIGDTLVVRAESSMGFEYDLEVYLNSSLVFEESGPFSGPLFNVSVPILPPAFNISGQYALSLSVYAYNTPLFGAYCSDSATCAFYIASVETRLEVDSKYDDVMKNLYVRANLTDVDGYAVANETVSFFLQLKSTHPLTDGWLPLGSRVTDSNGTARLNVGFSYSAAMSVKACHKGNADYGYCTQTADVEVTSNMTEALSYHYPEVSSSEYAVETSVLDAGVVSLAMSTNSPYALMPVTVEANYTTNSRLNGWWNGVIYYLDDLSGNVGASELILLPGGPPYTYTSLWPWPNCTEKVGGHYLIGGVVEAHNITDLSNALHNGTGIISSANLTLTVQPCPSSLVFDFAQALYGNASSVNVVFARPRTYNVNAVSGSTSCSLAPQFEYDGASYAIDEPISASVPVSLYVNSTLKCSNVTGANGLASLLLQLNDSTAYSRLNMRCVADGSSSPFQSASDERNVTFTRVNVNDAVTSQSGTFKVDCTVDGQDAPNGLSGATVYVGTDNSVKLGTRLHDSPVGSAPASILIGKPLTRVCTNGSGWATTSGDFLRLACLYDISNTSALASTDVNRDGKVNILDVSRVASAFGSFPGTAKWDWRSDVNLDVKVNILDVSSVASNFGKMVSYVNVSSYTAVTAGFLVGGTLNTAPLDRWGCVQLPPSSQTVEFLVGGVPVGAVAEFFNDSFHVECRSDSLGTASVSWSPPHVFQAYLALAWLPSAFETFTAENINTTLVNADLTSASYMNVTKRPVSFTLTNSSYVVHDLPLETVERAYVYQGNPYGNYVHDDPGFLKVGLNVIQNNDIREFRSFVKFDVSSIPANSVILSAKLRLLCSDASIDMVRNYGVYGVQSDWNESSLTWSNMPHDFSGWTCDLSKGPGDVGWWAWDVTAEVQSWQSGSHNYGFEIVDNGYSASVAEICSFYSGRDGGLEGPTLEVFYTQTGSISFSAEVLDGVSGSPVQGENVAWSVNGYQPTTSTNSSGVAVMSWTGPFATAAYVLSACYGGSDVHEASSASLCVDLRIPTLLAVNHEGNWSRDFVTFNVNAHEPRTFQIFVEPPGVSEAVNVYVNGTYFLSAAPQLIEVDPGFEYLWEAQFSWNANSTGVYYVNVTYAGDPAFRPVQVGFACIASAAPACLSFNATSEFAPGDNVTLWAEVVNPFSNQSLNRVAVEFWQNGTLTCVASATTNLDGVAAATWTYPTSSVNTVVAKLTPNQGLANCTLMVQPVTLTVGAGTQLLLEAWRDPGSTGHTVCARLVGANGLGLQGYTVTLNVNGTTYALQTNESGCVALHLALQPGDASANLYQVMAMFNGTNPRLASLNASDPYGDQYAVCTTAQYDLRPSTNSSALAVLLQSTDAMTMAKTSEQMQQEAKDSRSLSVYSEWSWGYPWYRLHVKMQVADPVTIDVGFNPILPWGETCSWNGLDFFRSLAGETIQLVATEALGLIGTYLLAKYTSLGSFLVGIGIEAVKIGAQFLFLIPSWNSAMAMLASALMSAVMLVFVVTDFGSTSTNFLIRLVDDIKGFCGGPVVNALTSILTKIKDMFLWGIGALSKWVDAMEAAADAVLLITSIARYNELIHT